MRHFRPSRLLRVEKSTLVDLSLIVLLGLAPLLWFRGGSLINGVDFALPLNAVDDFLRHVYVWDDRQYVGWDQSMDLPGLFPYRSFFALFDYLRAPILEAERIWFVIVFALPGLSMYYLMSVLKKRRAARLTSSVFYMFNPYVLIRWHNGQDVLLMPYGMLPILLGTYIKGLDEEGISVRYAVLIALASLFSATSRLAPGTMIIAIVLASYLIYAIVTGQSRPLHAAGFTVLTLFLCLLTNLWWIAPLFNFLLENFGTLSTTVGTAPLLSLFSRHSSFPEVFRMLGYWGWYEGHKGVPYFSFASDYSTNIALAGISFLVPILAWSSLGIASRKRPMSFFIFLSLFGMFFAQGAHPPLGRIYELLYFSFPGFWIFRNPYKFVSITVLGSAYLMGSTAGELHSRVLRGIGRISGDISGDYLPSGVRFAPAALLSALVILNSWPLLTGDVMDESFYVNIPAYYSDVGRWLTDQGEDFRYFLLPEGQFPYQAYTWGYRGGEIYPDLISTACIHDHSQSDHTQSVINTALESTRRNTSRYVGKLLGLMGAKYVLVDRSVDSSFYDVPEPIHYRRVLSTQDGIVFDRDIGELSAYRNEWFVPLIYPSSTVTYVDGDIPALIPLTSLEGFGAGQAIFFSSQLSPAQNEKVLEELYNVLVYRSKEDCTLTPDSASSDFYVPSAGRYSIYVNVLSSYDKTLSYQVDDGEVEVVPRHVIDTSENFTTIKVADRTLSEGTHRIAFILPGGGDENDFETGDLGDWTSRTTPDDAVGVTSSDSYSGSHSAEETLAGFSSSASIFKFFKYDGRSPIDLSVGMKIVSRKSPGGAYVYLQGYDADDVERVRIIYHTYDNWDYETSRPKEIEQTFYVLKIHVGDPAYDAWITVDRNAKEDFDAQFPGVWETLGLVRIRVALTSWCDGAIASRYDAVKVVSSGVYPPTNPVNHFFLFFGEPESGVVSSIAFERINPTKYRASVNAGEPFFLVFSESYHPQWRAYVEGEELPNDLHLVANGYANAWYLNRTGNYKMVLEYGPQGLFETGVAVSLITCAACVAYLLIRREVVI